MDRSTSTSSTGGTGTASRRKAPAPPPRRTSLPSQQSYDELKMKFLTTDRNYENLKQLARKGRQHKWSYFHLIVESDRPSVQTPNSSCCPALQRFWMLWTVDIMY